MLKTEMKSLPLSLLNPPRFMLIFLEECLKKAEDEWKRYHYEWSRIELEFSLVGITALRSAHYARMRRVVVGVRVERLTGKSIYGGLWSGILTRLFRLSEPPQILFQPLYLPKFWFVGACRGGIEERLRKTQIGYNGNG